MKNLIMVDSIEGIELSTFEELRELGYDIYLAPDEDKPKVLASFFETSDYIQIFVIYFSLKVTEDLAKGMAKQLLKNFSKTIKNIWIKLKDTKPAIIRANREPEYKHPKAIIEFQVSEEEKSVLEISNDSNQEEMEIILNGYIKLVKLQFKNRLKEFELLEKYQIKNSKKK